MMKQMQSLHSGPECLIWAKRLTNGDQLCSGHMVLVVDLQIPCMYSHLRAFALTAPSAWNGLFSDTHWTKSFISFKSLLNSYNAGEADIEYPI